MTETCGYRLLPDEIAERIGAKPDSRSPTGWLFGVKALAYHYERLGLDAVVVDLAKGRKVVRTAECKICGVFDRYNVNHDDGHYMQCDAENHRAYYDSFLSVG